MKKNISHLAPILAVRDMSEGLKFYNTLGFKTDFEWQDPPTYAVLTGSEEAKIHLSLLDAEHRDREINALVYVFAHDVDALYEICKKEGFALISDIGDRDYGMRDFDLKDPFGNQITFGKSLERIGT